MKLDLWPFFSHQLLFFSSLKERDFCQCRKVNPFCIQVVFETYPRSSTIARQTRPHSASASVHTVWARSCGLCSIRQHDEIKSDSDPEEKQSGGGRLGVGRERATWLLTPEEAFAGPMTCLCQW